MPSRRKLIQTLAAFSIVITGCSTDSDVPLDASHDGGATDASSQDAGPVEDTGNDEDAAFGDASSDAGSDASDAGPDCSDPSVYPCYLPFNPPAREVLRSAERQVYAHWHWFDLKINDRAPGMDYYSGWLRPEGEGSRYANVGGYLKERPLPRPPRESDDFRDQDSRQDVSWARDMGLDGFILNMWGDAARYESSWSSLLEAADESGDFDIIGSPDFAIMGSLSEPDARAAVLQIIEWLQAHPSAKRVDGRLVLSPFFPQNAPGGTAESHLFWADVLAEASSSLGEEIYFVPVFPGATDLSSYDDISEGVGGWNTAIEGDLEDAQELVERAGERGKFYMATINTQDSRPGRARNAPFTAPFWEPSQTGAMRIDAEGAIRSDAPWVQIATWNDHAEHHAVRPATGKQWATFDMLTYYTAWLKSDTQPAIVRDALYYSHRLHHTEADYDTTLQTGAYSSQVGDAEDQIELVAFLTEGGTLEIEFGGETSSAEVEAGIQVLRAPLPAGVAGTPVFRLRRSGTIVVELESQFPIQATVTYQDFLYRSGGSLRDALGVTLSCEEVCETGDVDACWGCPAEPVWMINR